MSVLIERYERTKELIRKLGNKRLRETAENELQVLTDNLLMYLSIHFRNQYIMPLLAKVSISILDQYRDEVADALSAGLESEIELSYLGIFLAICSSDSHNNELSDRLLSNIRKIIGYRKSPYRLLDEEELKEFDGNSAPTLLESFIKSLKIESSLE